MTLIVSVNSPETIWMLADRRLSYPGRRPKDDARKIMFLETKDGVAILGYAGLGATARGTEPADWMRSVLRGHNVSLERSLSILADAHQRQLPRHLGAFPQSWEPQHNVVIPVLLNDAPCLFSIDMQLARDRKSYRFRYTRHVTTGPDGAVTERAPRICVAGSGASYLLARKGWARELVQIVRACDEGRISHDTVATHLAAINRRVHAAMTNKSVGPRCVVAWRNRESGIHAGGGAHRYYRDGVADLDDGPMISSVGLGRDENALVAALLPILLQSVPLPGSAEPLPLNVNAMNAALATLTDEPDENLS